MRAKKRLLLLLAIIIYSGFSLSCSNDTNNPLDKQLQTGKSFFSLVYNAAFSERMRLDPKAAIPLKNGLQAVAIEIRRINYEYQCLLHFYTNDTVDLYMPDGDNYYHYTQEAEQFFIDAYNNEDQQWHSNMFNFNIMKMDFIEDSVATGGWIKSLSYDKVHRSFLPNLNIVSIPIFCHLLEKKHSPAKVRIQKSNIKNYLAGYDDFVNPKHPENFVLLPIPEKLIDQVAPYVKVAVRKEIQRLGLSN